MRFRPRQKRYKPARSMESSGDGPCGERDNSGSGDSGDGDAGAAPETQPIGCRGLSLPDGFFSRALAALKVLIHTNRGMFAQITPSAPVSASRSGMVQRAWEHFRSLGSPRYLCAPMVDASELAFRILVRRYGVQLAYTPMLHSGNFLRCEKYREEYFSTCAIDRPLVAQFCGNEPDTLVAAAKLVEPHVDAIDLNLGCPQNIARRGRYGAFLQDDWALVQRLVSSLNAACRVPVWCKIRVFPDESRTLAYAQLLENAGCAVLAVHGRTRDQKGNEPGPANWSIIKQIKEHLHIPVLLNGNIQSWADVQRGLAETRCDGILSADRLLAYPALFSGREDLCIYQLAHEYLDIVERYDPRTHPRIIRGHLFRMLTADIRRDETIRNGLLQAHTVAAFTDVLEMAERRAANISRMESAPASTSVEDDGRMSSSILLSTETFR